MRGRYLKNHCEYYLSAYIDIPHAWKIRVIALQHALRKNHLSNVQADVNYKQYETKVNELDPADGSDRAYHYLLLVNRSGELCTILDKQLYCYVS